MCRLCDAACYLLNGMQSILGLIGRLVVYKIVVKFEIKNTFEKRIKKKPGLLLLLHPRLNNERLFLGFDSTTKCVLRGND